MSGCGEDTWSRAQGDPVERIFREEILERWDLYRNRASEICLKACLSIRLNTNLCMCIIKISKAEERAVAWKL